MAQDGRIDPKHVEVFAHMLLASVNEVALLIASAADTDAAISGGGDALRAMLSRLLDPPAATPSAH